MDAKRSTTKKSDHLANMLMLDYIIQVTVPKEKRKEMIKSRNKNNNKTINRVTTNATKTYNYDQKRLDLTKFDYNTSTTTISIRFSILLEEPTLHTIQNRVITKIA